MTTRVYGSCGSAARPTRRSWIGSPSLNVCEFLDELPYGHCFPDPVDYAEVYAATDPRVEAGSLVFDRRLLTFVGGCLIDANLDGQVEVSLSTASCPDTCGSDAGSGVSPPVSPPIQTDCCEQPIATVLYATITNKTGDHTSMPDSITLVYNGTYWTHDNPVGPANGTMYLQCLMLSWLNGGNFGYTSGTLASASCVPFAVSWTGANWGGYTGSFDMTITE